MKKSLLKITTKEQNDLVSFILMKIKDGSKEFIINDNNEIIFENDDKVSMIYNKKNKIYHILLIQNSDNDLVDLFNKLLVLSNK